MRISSLASDGIGRGVMLEAAVHNQNLLPRDAANFSSRGLGRLDNVTNPRPAGYVPSGAFFWKVILQHVTKRFCFYSTLT
jgi:hypothetical protein